MKSQCPICNGPTALGVTPASQPMCIDNDCDKLEQADRDALLVLPMKERLRSIDVMKGRITLEEQFEDEFNDIWNEKTQEICLHTKQVVLYGVTYCADCSKNLSVKMP